MEEKALVFNHGSRTDSPRGSEQSFTSSRARMVGLSPGMASIMLCDPPPTGFSASLCLGSSPYSRKNSPTPRGCGDGLTCSLTEGARHTAHSTALACSHYCCCPCSRCLLSFIWRRRRRKRRLWRCDPPLLKHQSFSNVLRFSPTARTRLVRLPPRGQGQTCVLGRSPSPSRSDHIGCRVPPPLPRPGAFLPRRLLPGPALSSLFRDGTAVERGSLPRPLSCPLPMKPPLSMPRRTSVNQETVGGVKGSLKELQTYECIRLNFLEMDGPGASPR